MSVEADSLKKAIHALSLNGCKSRDEAHALGKLSYYITGPTLEKLVAAVKEPIR